MAYSLSLHEIDRDRTRTNEDVENASRVWVEQEEKRRAWWAIFQMDNFASVIASRPFNIDSHRMNVLLPVSDDAWFNCLQTPSAPLSSKGPSEIWKSLQGCENQDPYAWFIVCNDLLRAAQQEFDKLDRSIHDLKVLQSALHCLALSLSVSFRLSGMNMIFNDRTFAEKNWTMCTLVLLQW
jgi:Fungal specific transcription factor domain